MKSVSCRGSEEGRITGLIVQSKSGRQVIEGKVYVDATGDDDIAAMAGAPYDRSRLQLQKLTDLQA